MKHFRGNLRTHLGESQAAHQTRLGLIAYSRKEYAQALVHFDQALAIAPGHIEAHRYRGHTQACMGNLAEALESHSRVAALTPQDAKAQNEVGSLKGTMGDARGALESFEKAIALRPQFGEAHFNRGRALLELGEYRLALESYDRAAKLLPDNPDLHNNRGTLQEMQGQYEEALTSYAKALSLWPALPEATATGRALLDHYANRPPPDLGPARAHNNRALCLLSLGRFSEAWPEYEWRWFVSPGNRRTFPVPQWRGEPIEGKTILVHAEQGIGDSIQFSRYLPVLQARGARVLFGIRAREDGLRELLLGLGAPLKFVYWQDSSLAYDYHCPMLSLPLAFDTRLDSIPAPAPLAVPRERVKKWQRIIGKGGFKIGICWQGNPEHLRDKERSFPLRHFAGIAAISGVRLINLHKGVGEAQIQDAPFKVENHNEQLSSGVDSWLDTAGRLSQCDLVISCDTAVVHLAGTLGIPVWLALPRRPDWRWLQDREDSPWYPTLRLFRQRAARDWAGVFAELERAYRFR